MTVHEITLDGGGQVSALSVTYEQHCEGATPAFVRKLHAHSGLRLGHPWLSVPAAQLSTRSMRAPRPRRRASIRS